MIHPRAGTGAHNPPNTAVDGGATAGGGVDKLQGVEPVPTGAVAHAEVVGPAPPGPVPAALAQARRMRASSELLRRQARATALRALQLRRVTRQQQRRFAGIVLLLASEALPAAGGSVLVADDDASVRDTLRDVLELAAHRVHVAGDGEEALEILDTHAIDVLVLDLDMPKVDGWAVLRALSSRRPVSSSRPVIIVHTGQDLTPRDIREFFEVRPYGVLPKPVAPSHMLAAVDAALVQARATA